MRHRQGRTGHRGYRGIPGGPTGLGWSKIPAHFHHRPTGPPSDIAGTSNYFPFYTAWTHLICSKTIYNYWLSFLLLLAICIHTHGAHFSKMFWSVFWNVFLRTSDVQRKKRHIRCHFFVIIQNKFKCIDIFPSRPLIGRYVRCIEWATRRVLNEPPAVYWVGWSEQ